MFTACSCSSCTTASLFTLNAGTSPDKIMGNASVSTEPSVSKQWQQDASNFTDEKLNDVLKGLDNAVGQILDTLPANGMLVLYTCQGDTAEYRRLQVHFSSIMITTLALAACVGPCILPLGL